ncbi:MAG TPA: thermonuclease family protein [Solirubrobacterales bacterium]|nr:thermonuclease family protein [Solirubrobacterales bacterium]
MRRGALRGPLLLALLIAVLALSRCATDGGGEPAEPQGPVTAQVTDVVDGDTIEVELADGTGEDVRYIGIDTPETVKPDAPVECGGPRAHHLNERLVSGRAVTLRFDAERRDVYGRLLAYVYLPPSEPGGRGLFVNAELVKRGVARMLTIPPNDSFAELFARLAARAGARGLGIWGRCPL